MIARLLFMLGFRGWMMQGACFGVIGLCIGLWIRAKSVGQDERGNAERRALFVGLWPPTFWMIGQSLEEHAMRRAGLSGRLRGLAGGES